jgi:plasmid stability protein
MTVRNIPESVESRLRQLATRSGTSLNQTVVRLLEEATGVTRRAGPKRNLAAFAGRWNPDEVAEFDAAGRIFEAIDAEVWR